jgi:hypothetical protein
MNGQQPAPEPAAGKWLAIHKKLRASTLALLTANLMPLIGVLALNWDVTPIMIFYRKPGDRVFQRAETEAGPAIRLSPRLPSNVRRSSSFFSIFEIFVLNLLYNV